ncbi:beta-ketoacyl-[acyl-carrier-protein] synthase family protein [Acetobacteroides hydrogenigenes]|uniref:3-oxoacyl-[acyl-carrier-protein] synthase 1 n=1 Tax=Acetobacteroides hydrogenigenes TaxID=979970 RepID=A0A4R2E5P3_9BACT|nr:beta-ketoacyl-[acyl-carrier-protein] synthase family protein [Acetobacteroides hydrogenigenes]TCN62895.1 3-oxoacyl-[acyl-carrier-protein] synthase-1 [Acetobacteroides hydrogenigenes]
MNRVVITGMGIYSCIGKNLEEVKDSLYNGKSGIGLDPARKEMGFRSGLTGMLELPNLKGKLDRRSRVCLPEQGYYAYVATLEALQNAGVDHDFLMQNEVGILYGNDSSAKAVIEGVDILRAKNDTTLIGSGNIFQAMNSTVTMNLSTIFNLRGINFTIAGACASGSHSIGMAYLLIKNGLQDYVICGGAQEVNSYSVGSFDGLSAFSIREDDPAAASRPFDKNRDGLIPSGGAATLFVESLDSALRRGAPILGEIVGYGFSSNGEHISVPNVDGPSRSLRMAIKDAGIDCKAIAYVNAHATSTPIGDFNEAKAIADVFGDNKPYVASTKSMTGHEMWMAGASEIIYSTLMMQNGFIAPNINLAEKDEASEALNIPTQTVDVEFDTFLSNSFGFGGTNSTLIVKKYNK